MYVTAIADLEPHVAAMPALRVDWAELAPEQPSVQKPPRFVLGEVPGGLVLPMLGELVTGPVRCYLARDLRVGPDGLLLDGSVALSSNLLNFPDYHVHGLVTRMNASPTLPVRWLNKRAAWLCGPGSRVYGHWLVDFLPRLWALETCGHALDSLSFIIAEPMAPFVVPLLATFGIGAHQLERYDESTEMLEVEELLVPTNMRRGGRLHCLMKDARDLLLRRSAAVCAPFLEQQFPERIFITREAADPSRTLANRAAIEQIAVEAGFTVVQPELLSHAEQIASFRNVRQVVGEYGSGLHNVMFGGRPIMTCALRGSSVHPGFIQSALSEVFGQSIGYVLAPTPLEAVEQVPEIQEHAFRIALECAALIMDEA